MMDFGFANYEVVSVLKKDQVVKDNVYVSGGKEEFIDGVVSQNVSFLIKTGSSGILIRKSYGRKDRGPFEEGDKIGTLTITQGDKVVQNLDIVSDRDVLRANVFDYFKKIFSNWIRK